MVVNRIECNRAAFGICCHFHGVRFPVIGDRDSRFAGAMVVIRYFALRLSAASGNVTVATFLWEEVTMILSV